MTTAREFYAAAIADADALCAATPRTALLREELLRTEREVGVTGWSQAPVLMAIHDVADTVVLDLHLPLTTALRATIHDHRLPLHYFLAELAQECERRAANAGAIPPFPGTRTLLGVALLFESAAVVDSTTIRGRYLQAATGDGMVWTVVRFRDGEPFCYLTRRSAMLDATGTIPHTLSRIVRAATGCNTGPAPDDEGTQEA